MSDGKIIEEEKGIMAGVPIASFLANYYLKDLDNYFYKHGVTYCRYADDIIVFDDKEMKPYYLFAELQNDTWTIQIRDKDGNVLDTLTQTWHYEY